MRLRTAALVVIALGYQTLASPAPAAAAAPSFEKVEQAVVIVTASGVLTNFGNAPAAAQGTAFFVHRDGYLVTSYHLRKDLGDVDKDTVKYAIHFGPNDADTYPAIEMFSNPAADIMVLYASVGNRSYEILQRGSRDGIQLGTTTVYTGGYPAGYHFSVDNGVIKSFGPVEPIPAWATSITFKSGQSGSPIVRDNLRVIAIAKGNDADANSIGLIVPASAVPSNFWDGTTKLNAKAAGALTDFGFATPVVYTQVAVDDNAPVQRRVTFKVQNDLCEPSKSKDHQFPATDGWVIDPDSISIERLSSTGEATRFAVTERTPASFNVAVELANIGKCVQVFDRTIAAGIAADFTGLATYTERPASRERLLTVSEASPLGSVISPLPDVDRKRFKFSIRKPDGSVYEFTPSSNELFRRQGTLVLDNKAAAERILNEQF